MAIIDARLLPDGADISGDICIVGAGASGITLATELESTGARVCLLESGHFDLDEEVQSLYDVDSVGYPLRENFMSRVRYFGGSCNLWAGRAMRMSPIDFERRSWVPGSGWPISYSDVEPYYERAEEILKLPSFARFCDLDHSGIIGAEERALFKDPALHPAIALWGIKPLRFGKLYRGRIRRSSSIGLYLNANVTEIVASSSGQAVDGLVVKTLTGRTFAVRAGIYVLCAGGLENARLLLVSRSHNPDGLGNEHDAVGRYYLDHPRAIFGTIRINGAVSLPYLTGIPVTNGKVQFGIGLSERAQREHGLLNCYVSLEPRMSEFAERQYGRSVNILKVLLRRGHAGSRFRFSGMNVSSSELIYLLTPKEIMPHFLYRPYAALKRRVRRNRVHDSLTMINFCEQGPDPDSRITLGAGSDALGMQKLVLNWRLGNEVKRNITILHEVLGRSIHNAGIGVLESDTANADDLCFTDASHHMGTTRMSEVRQTGVVDRHCKVHALANLYIGGSSVFPTTGYANPTLTIVALTLRLADRLKCDLCR